MNVLIIEDEKKTADFLKELIEENDDYLVVNICQSVASAVTYLQKNQSKIDLIFMDVQLGDGESFEIFNQLEVIKPVVFCTAYSDYVLKAFKSNGIDYILKPFHQKDVESVLQKVKRLSGSFINLKFSESPHIFKQPTEYQNTFITRFREKMIPLSVDEIGYISLEDGSVYVYKFNGEKFPLFDSLDEVEAMIDPRQFFRINRQTIVNRKSIKEIEPYFNRKMQLTFVGVSDEKPLVSRLKVGAFMEWLKWGG